MTALPLPFLSVAVLAPVLGAMAVPRTRSVRLARLLALLALAVSLGASAAAVWQVKLHGTTMAEPWALPLWGAAHPWLAVDMLSSFGMVLFSTLALLTIAMAPRRDLERPRLVQMLLLVTATLSVYAADHLLVLLGGWALASLPMAFAKYAGAERSSSRGTILLRIVLTSALVALAAAVALIAWDAPAGVASPFSLEALRGAGAPGGQLAFALLMLAVLLTKGIFPMHSWVLSAFDRGSLLTAGLFVNAHLGAFLIVKVAIPVMPGAALRALPVLSDVALFTMCYTAVLALRERAPRRVLGLLFVGQASSILVGLESATEAGVTGALVHWIVVAASTTSLASVLRLVETRVGARIGSSRFLGLANQFPRLAVFFLISGLALVGLPGTLGFCAEDLLIHGTLESHPLLGIALPVSTALFAFHLLRLFSMLFLGNRSSSFAIVPDAIARERICLTALVAFLVLFGIAPGWIVKQQSGVATQLVEKLRGASEQVRPVATPLANSLRR